MGSNWQPWDSRQGGDIRNPAASLECFSTFHSYYCCAVGFFFFYILYTLLSLSWNSGRLTRVRLHQPHQEQRYPALQVHAGSFRVSVIHRNPPNYDMDFRIFNVRTWSFFLCVRRPLHTGVGHTDESAHFWLRKTLTNLSCAPDGVGTSGLWISSPTIYQLSHPAIPCSGERYAGRTENLLVQRISRAVKYRTFSHCVTYVCLDFKSTDVDQLFD